MRTKKKNITFGSLIFQKQISNVSNVMFAQMVTVVSIRLRSIVDIDYVF